MSFRCPRSTNDPTHSIGSITSVCAPRRSGIWIITVAASTSSISEDLNFAYELAQRGRGDRN
jgi:hypothetical protein